MLFQREAAVFEQGPVSLRGSGTAEDAPVLLSPRAQQECIIDAVHAQLEPTFVYETGQSTPLEDIGFALNEGLSNGVESHVISHQDLSMYLSLIPSYLSRLILLAELLLRAQDLGVTDTLGLDGIPIRSIVPPLCRSRSFLLLLLPFVSAKLSHDLIFTILIAYSP